ncbi:hypothetical protein D9M69_656960 [compost metagenome]
MHQQSFASLAGGSLGQVPVQPEAIGRANLGIALVVVGNIDVLVVLTLQNCLAGAIDQPGTDDAESRGRLELQHLVPHDLAA